MEQTKITDNPSPRICAAKKVSFRTQSLTSDDNSSDINILIPVCYRNREKLNPITLVTEEGIKLIESVLSRTCFLAHL